MGLLNGKVAIITGGNSGIGQATAELFKAEGAAVVIVARREMRNQKVAKELGVDYLTGDMTDSSDAKMVVDRVYEKYGKIDVLVNSAGIPDGHHSVKNITDAFWDRIIKADLTSAFYVCREVLRYMEPAEEGVIVNVGSIGGVYHCAGAAYSAAKSGMIAMTHNLAIQYAGKGIRCNCVCPGPTKTPLFDPENAGEQDDDMAMTCAKHVRSDLPMCEAIDQANAILFFASDKSKCVTGQYLVIDNGMCL